MREAGLVAEISDDLPRLLRELPLGAGLAVLTEESIRSADIKGLANWTSSQPPWSDFPFVILTERGAGVERNPAAERQAEALGNVTFLERPFHPTTLISVVKTALRGRLRQYEARGSVGQKGPVCGAQSRGRMPSPRRGGDRPRTQARERAGARTTRHVAR